MAEGVQCWLRIGCNRRSGEWEPRIDGEGDGRDAIAVDDPWGISVVIPCWEAHGTLAAAVRSALEQTVEVREVLVVDDGSTPPVRSADLPEDPRVRLMQRPHSGQVIARNAGLIEARGRWLAFLDADDLWHPRKLEIQLAVFDRHPEAGAVVTSGRVYTGGDQAVSEVWDGAGVDLKATVQAAYRLALRDLARANLVLKSSVLIAREVMDVVGLPDPVMRGVEDWEYWLRVIRRFPILCVEHPLVLRLERSTGVSHRLSTAAKCRLTRSVFDRHQSFLLEGLGPAGLMAAKACWNAFFGIRFLIFENDTRAARRLLISAWAHHPNRWSLWRPWVASWLPVWLRRRVSDTYQRPDKRKAAGVGGVRTHGRVRIQATARGEIEGPRSG